MTLLFSTDPRILAEYLRQGGDPDIEDPSGFSAVHSAAWLCRADLLEVLVSSGATFDSVDINGISPLMLAAERGCGDAVRLLLRAGATPGRQDLEGVTALSRAVRNGHDEAAGLLAEALTAEHVLMKEVSFVFPGGGEVASFASRCKNDPLLWFPLTEGIVDYTRCWLSVEGDEDSESLVALDLRGSEWYIFITGGEIIARRKE